MPSHFVSLADHTREHLRAYLDLARMVKLNPNAFANACAGQTLAMIFQKPSLRTRVSFETGIYQLGGQGIYLGPKDIQLHRGESISDTTQVLSRYVDGIMARVFAHSDVVELAAHGSIPVINGLSDLLHPCQVLADLQTIEEKLDTLSGRKLTYIGDGNNMAHSLLYGGATMGMTVAIGHPHGYAPDPEVVTRAREIAAEQGGAVLITEDVGEAVSTADVVYTDVWASMGQEAEANQRRKVFAPYQVNAQLMSQAPSGCLFMHDLPAHRGEEVTDEILDGPRSIAFQQAENRMHLAKGLLVWVEGLKDEG